MDINKYLESDIKKFLDEKKKELELEKKGAKKKEKFEIKKDYESLMKDAIDNKDFGIAKGLFLEVQKKLLSTKKGEEKDAYMELAESLYTLIKVGGNKELLKEIESVKEEIEEEIEEPEETPEEEEPEKIVDIGGKEKDKKETATEEKKRKETDEKETKEDSKSKQKELEKKKKKEDEEKKKKEKEKQKKKPSKKSRAEIRDEEKKLKGEKIKLKNKSIELKKKQSTIKNQTDKLKNEQNELVKEVKRLREEQKKFKEEVKKLRAEQEKFKEEVKKLKEEQKHLKEEEKALEESQEELINETKIEILKAQRNIAESLNKKDLKSAIKEYKAMKEHFNDIPSKSAKTKEEMFNDLISSYYQIRKLERIMKGELVQPTQLKDEEFIELFKQTKENVSLLTKRITVLLGDENLKQAINEYNNLKKLFDEFPKESKAEKKNLYKHTIKIYKNIRNELKKIKTKSVTEKKPTSKGAKDTYKIIALKNEIKEIITLMKAKKLEEAEIKLLNVKKESNSLPDEKAEEKSKLEHISDELSHRLNFLRHTTKNK